MFLSWFGIGYLIGGYIARDFSFFFFGIRFSGVTLALVYPVNPELVSPFHPELTDISVQSVSTTITSGAGASDWVI